MATTNTKIPQTESGLTTLKNGYAITCRKAVTNGFFGVGLTWNNPSTFGDPETFRRNIRDVGWYIYSLPIAQQSQSEREQRKAPVIQIAGKESGALHSSEVFVSIEQ